jgi:hypothetical protein
MNTKQFMGIVTQRLNSTKSVLKGGKKRQGTSFSLDVIKPASWENPEAKIKAKLEELS